MPSGVAPGSGAISAAVPPSLPVPLACDCVASGAGASLFAGGFACAGWPQVAGGWQRTRERRSAASQRTGALEKATLGCGDVRVDWL